MIEFKSGVPKPPSPFKFNSAWLQNEDYIKLVGSTWEIFNPEVHGHAAVHFMKNLNNQICDKGMGKEEERKGGTRTYNHRI